MDSWKIKQLVTSLHAKINLANIATTLQESELKIILVVIQIAVRMYRQDKDLAQIIKLTGLLDSIILRQSQKYPEELPTVGEIPTSSAEWNMDDETLLEQYLNRQMDFGLIMQKLGIGVGQLDQKLQEIAVSMRQNGQSLETISVHTGYPIRLIELFQPTQPIPINFTEPIKTVVKPNKAGKRWSQQEHASLLMELLETKDFQEIADRHERTSGAIRARVRQIAVDQYDAGDPMEQIVELTSLSKEEIEESLKHRNQKQNSSPKPSTTKASLTDLTDRLTQLEASIQNTQDTMIIINARLDQLEKAIQD